MGSNPRAMQTQDICARVTFAGALEALGLPAPSKGYMRCPNPDHADNRPSAKVDSRKGVELFYCHSCGTSGNVIGLVMAARQCTARAAMEWLGEIFSLDVDLPKVRRPTRADYNRALARLGEEYQPPKEEFLPIYWAHLEWLFHHIVKWEARHTDYGERLRELKQWEVRVLKGYRAQMRDEASTRAREAFEASGEDLGTIVKVPSDVWRLRHSKKGEVAKW